MLRPRLPMSVPAAPAMADPPELGIGCPAGSTGRAKAYGLKKKPCGAFGGSDTRLDRARGLLPPESPYNEPAPVSTTSIGRPDIAVMIPATCQLASSGSATLGLGRLQSQ